MSGDPAGPLPAREERLQRARAVVTEALDALDEADPYRRALAEILGLVPLPIAAVWARRRPLGVERIIRGYAARLLHAPEAPPSRRDVIAVRHAAQHPARTLLA
ncbi:hypothetical protein [Amnibacterium sp.]|uniref:hypothetical protein n=1 Tax=Amnibacterium sp. TaxID=1872496 RepID=UPI003F7C0723